MNRASSGALADQQPEEQGPVQQIERHLDVQPASDLAVADRPFQQCPSLRPASQHEVIAEGLDPYLIVKDATKAIEFYKTAFGAEEVFRLTEPQGKIGHAELQIRGSRLMLADEYPDFGALSPTSVGGSPVSIHLYVEDVDCIVDAAAAAGATVLRPVKDELYGDRTGMIADPFGHKWQIATPWSTCPPEEMQRRWTATLA